jgi:hypothetical protein
MRATGAKMRLWPAAFVPTGGLRLGASPGSLAMAALAFGFGVVIAGPAQVRASENRCGRSIGFVPVAGGALNAFDAGTWMLTGAQGFDGERR